MSEGYQKAIELIEEGKITHNVNLDLRDFSLTEISEEIKDLKNLENLNLANNQLSNIRLSLIILNYLNIRALTTLLSESQA